MISSTSAGRAGATASSASVGMPSQGGRCSFLSTALQKIGQTLGRAVKKRLLGAHSVRPVSTIERRATVVAVVLPFVAFLAAVGLAWGGLVSGRDLAIFAVM